MIDSLQLLFHKWPVYQGAKNKQRTWPPQGKRIIPFSSSFHRPLQRGCEMLTNGIKCQPLCIYFLIKCIPGICSWGHRKAKRMLAFSRGGVESESVGRSGRWGRTGFVPPLDPSLSLLRGFFPSFTSQQSPAKPCSRPGALPSPPPSAP